jgi:hypothetical protein
MRGQNSMPSHARQVDAYDVWSVIHHIRQMQKTEPVAPPPASAPARAAGATQAGASADKPAAAKEGAKR